MNYVVKILRIHGVFKMKKIILIIFALIFITSVSAVVEVESERFLFQTIFTTDASINDTSWWANWTAYNTSWSFDTTWLANWTAYNTSWSNTYNDTQNQSINNYILELNQYYH